MEKIGAYTDRVTASEEWQGGDVQSGLRATPMKSEYFNMLQRELVAVVQGAGIDLDKEDDGQLLQAIRRIRGGAAANFGTWVWSESLNGNPGQAHVALNNADAALATELRISEVSADAEDFTQSLSLLRAGDTITFQDQGAVLSYRFRVTSAGVDNGAYRSVPIRFLSGSGGLPDESTVVSVLLTLAGASDDGLPLGAIIPLPKAGVPTGYLELDGGEHSIAAFPDLAAYLGTTYNKGNESAGFFRLPDTRGEFLRGWDHGRGVDAGRGLGSYQADELKAHTHKYGNTHNMNYGLSQTALIGVNPSASVNYDTSAVGGAETRPRNLAVMWCIKAWSAPVSQGNVDIGALAVQVSEIQGRQKALGDGQIWRDVKASRALNTNYTNTTGRAIVVSVSMAARAGDEAATIVVAGVVAAQTINNGTAGEDFWMSAIVPSGAVYSVNAFAGLAVGIWTELR